MARKQLNMRKKQIFKDNLIVNDLTYQDYLERFKKIALSIFEWVNLPPSMNAIWLEKCLYYNGQASLLKDKKYGFINTKCCSNGNINIYGLPNSLNCYSFDYQSNRKLFTGLNETLTPAQKEMYEYYECILVQNNWERIPTARNVRTFCI